jgi:hypothetical protein
MRPSPKLTFMTGTSPITKWILIVSGIFVLLELAGAVMLLFMQDSMADKIDLHARGVDFLLYMWAARQFALAAIIAVAVYKRSAPMLSLAWIFLLLMFIGDLAIGFVMKDNPMIISAVVMAAIAAIMLYFINRAK